MTWVVLLVQLLLAYVSPPFDENPLVNKQMAEGDANALYKAGEKRFGTDEKTFIRIFSERSRAHLAEVANLYNKRGSSLQKVLGCLLFILCFQKTQNHVFTYYDEK